MTDSFPRFIAGQTAGLLKGFEYLGSRWPALGRLYGRLFYGPMVRRELELAAVDGRHRILHLGCGPLPLTAMVLAEAGLRVDAVDRDPEAASSAARVIAGSGLDQRINVICADGCEVDYAGYDAVWVSFHVHPRRECLERILLTLNGGGRIIYRNPRGWRKGLYSHVEPTSLIGTDGACSTRQAFAKETVMMRKAPQMGGTLSEEAHAASSVAGE